MPVAPELQSASVTPELNAAARRRRSMTIAALVAVVALIAAALLHGSPSSAATDVRPLSGIHVGLSADALDNSAPFIAREVRSYGVRWLREEFRPALLEPRRGQFDYRRVDALMEGLSAQGIHVLPVLYGSPKWTGRPLSSLPPSLPDWQQLVRVVTRRYGPGGAFWKAHPKLDASLAPKVWEVWNEPFFPQFSAGKPDPARYAALVKATVKAGREVDPTARYLAAGQEQYVTASGEKRDWIADLHTAAPDIDRYVSAYTAHPYSDGAPRDAQGRWPLLSGLLGDLARHGARGKPVWITEMGWSTCAFRGPCVTERQQAAYLAQAFELVRTRYRRSVQAFFVYGYLDPPGTREDPQNGYGVLRNDGRPSDGPPKPALRVLEAAAGRRR